MTSLTITTDDTGAHARYFVSGTDPFVMGHYIGNPIFPGVLILDMLNDVAEAFAARHFGSASTTLIKRVQYLQATVPGDVLELAVALKQKSEDTMTLTATASTGGVVRTRATLECRGLTLPESAYA